MLFIRLIIVIIKQGQDAGGIVGPEAPTALE